MDEMRGLRDMALSKFLAEVDMPAGRARLAAHLATLPYPHYEGTDTPDVLVRIEADGTRTRGRFVGREWIREE